MSYCGKNCIMLIMVCSCWNCVYWNLFLSGRRKKVLFLIVMSYWLKFFVYGRDIIWFVIFLKVVWCMKYWLVYWFGVLVCCNWCCFFLFIMIMDLNCCWIRKLMYKVLLIMIFLFLFCFMKICKRVLIWLKWWSENFVILWL